MAFTKFLIAAAVAALSFSASVSALPASTGGKNWDTSKFEPYDKYHTRYNALGCSKKHNTPFFKQCCGPLSKGQPLSSRPAQCKPGNNKPADNGGKDEDDCDDDKDDEPTPAPSSTKKVTSTSTKKPAPTTGGTTHKGKATWYRQNGIAGACGKKNPDSALIVAMNFQLYGNMNRVSSVCGKKVRITNTSNGKEVTATVADACPTCPGKGDLDLSRGAFQQIGDFDTGVLPITWRYV